MKKYMLIVCIEREISEPRLYDTHEEAYAEMEKILIENIIDGDSDGDYLTEDGKLETTNADDYEIDDNMMWSNICGDYNVDAKIYKIEM